MEDESMKLFVFEYECDRQFNTFSGSIIICAQNYKNAEALADKEVQSSKAYKDYGKLIKSHTFELSQEKMLFTQSLQNTLYLCKRLD